MKGRFTAVVGHIGRRNANGGTFEPGCVFEQPQTVLISAWDHCLNGAGVCEAAGLGHVTVEDDEIVLRGRFHLAEGNGEVAYHLVRYLGARCRWSLSWDALGFHTERIDGELVRKHTQLRFYEVTPCLRAADMDTHTVEIDGEQLNTTEDAA